MTWRGQLDRAKTKYRHTGLSGVASRAVPFVVATGVNGLINRARAREWYVDRSNVRDHCDGPFFQVGSEEELFLSPPINTNENPFKCTGREHFASDYVCEFHNVRLLTKDAIKIASDGHVLAEEHYDSMARERLRTAVYRHVRDRGPLSSFALSSELIFNRHSSEAQDHYDCVFPMVGHPTSFYHWIIEYLPRIRLYENYISETGRNPTLLLSRNPPDYVTTSLNLLGYTESDWKTMDHVPATVDRFVLPSHIRNKNSIPKPAACRWLRNRLIDAVDTASDPNEPRRIYISRADARERRVMNEEELTNVLNRFGFERVVLSEIELEEQISLFHNADTVIAPHGAGLVNIIYGQDLTVVELFNQDILPHYYHLSSILDHEYHFYSSAEADDIDMKINPEEFTDHLKQANILPNIDD